MPKTKITTVPGDFKDVWEALGIERPSDEELYAARKAVRSLRRRQGEDIDRWAADLGAHFGKMAD
jgi:hypothetical protein